MKIDDTFYTTHSSPELIRVPSLDEETAIEHDLPEYGPHLVKEPVDLGSFRTQDTSLVSEARKLIADVYLKLDFIGKDDVDPVTGVIKDESDPYVSHSEYYVRQREVEGIMEVTSTVRKILFDEDKKEESFPVLQHEASFDADYIDEIYTTGLENCVEISALAKKYKDDMQEPLKLYRSMWQDALRSKGTDEEEKLWLMAASPALFGTFEIYFNGAIKRIGPNLNYPGQEAIPAILNPIEGFIELVSSLDKDPELKPIRKMVVEFLIDGLQKDQLGDDLNNLLEENGFVLGDDDVVHTNNYQSPLKYDLDPKSIEDSDDTDDGTVDKNEEDNDKEDRGTALTGEQDEKAADKKYSLKNIRERIKNRKPELISSVALIGYTALRTEAVRRGISPDSDTDWRVFLGIEIATTPPYVLGMGDLIRSLGSPEDYSKKRLAAASAFASSAFLSPYVYVAATGGESLADPYVAGGIAAFFGLGAISAAKQVRQARKEATIN